MNSTSLPPHGHPLPRSAHASEPPHPARLARKTFTITHEPPKRIPPVESAGGDRSTQDAVATSKSVDGDDGNAEGAWPLTVRPLSPAAASLEPQQQDRLYAWSLHVGGYLSMLATTGIGEGPMMHADAAAIAPQCDTADPFEATGDVSKAEAVLEEVHGMSAGVSTPAIKEGSELLESATFEAVPQTCGDFPSYAQQLVRLIQGDSAWRLLVRDFRLDDRAMAELVSHLRDQLKQHTSGDLEIIANGCRLDSYDQNKGA